MNKTVPCKLCSNPTNMLGTKLCDRCWELETRINAAPALAKKILYGVARDSEHKVLEIARNDATVHRLINENKTYADIAVWLAKEKTALINRIMKLEQIAPRRFKVGSVEMVWQCPTNLIPLTELTNERDDH